MVILSISTLDTGSTEIFISNFWPLVIELGISTFDILWNKCSTKKEFKLIWNSSFKKFLTVPDSSLNTPPVFISLKYPLKSSWNILTSINSPELFLNNRLPELKFSLASKLHPTSQPTDKLLKSSKLISLRIGLPPNLSIYLFSTSLAAVKTCEYSFSIKFI